MPFNLYPRCKRSLCLIPGSGIKYHRSSFAEMSLSVGLSDSSWKVNRCYQSAMAMLFPCQVDQMAQYHHYTPLLMFILISWLRWCVKLFLSYCNSLNLYSFHLRPYKYCFPHYTLETGMVCTPIRLEARLRYIYARFRLKNK